MWTSIVKGKKKEEAIDVAGEWPLLAFLHAIPIEMGTASKWLPILIPKLRPVTQFYLYWIGPDDPVKGRSLELQERVQKRGLHNVTVIESATVEKRVQLGKSFWDRDGQLQKARRRREMFLMRGPG